MKKRIFIISIISLVIDLLTKILIDNSLSIGQSYTIINNFFYLTRVSNTGAAFSILEGKVLLLSIISIITLIILIRYMKNFKTSIMSDFAFGLIIGGILGNFGDRVFLGYVRDFLKFDIFQYQFPVFNVADMCIVIGVFFLIICILRGDEVANSSK